MPVEMTPEAHRGRDVNPMRRAEPDMRVLGVMALGLSVLSAVFAVSYFFSHVAYLAGALALPLGVLSRGHQRSHALGTAAVVMAVVAVVWATMLLFVLP